MHWICQESQIQDLVIVTRLRPCKAQRCKIPQACHLPMILRITARPVRVKTKHQIAIVFPPSS